MRFALRLIFVTFFTFAFSFLKGQLTPLSDHYILNPLTINPATAGLRGSLNVAAFYRRQWVGINGAPETITLSSDMPIMDGKVGLGLKLANDRIGVTKETSLNAYYSYKIDAAGGNLSFGLGTGIITTNTAWSDLIVIDPGDDFYLIDSRTFVLPDFSFGMYYSRENLFAAVSVPRLLGYKFNFDRNRYSIKINPGEYYYLLNAGYAYQIRPGTVFLPSTLISFSPGRKLLADINLHFSFSDRLWAGFSYRSTNSASGLLQVAITDQLRIAYSYYFDFSKLRTYSNGSHEVMLRYEFRYRIKVVNPLIF